MKVKTPVDYLSTIDKSIFIKSLINLHFSHIIFRSTILHTRISLSKFNQIHLSVSVYFLVYQELSQRSLLWVVRSKRSSSQASFLVVEGRGISVSTRQSSRVSKGEGGDGGSCFLSADGKRGAGWRDGHEQRPSI